MELPSPTWGFPNEINFEIAQYLPKRDLLSLCCVCHQLRAIAASILYRKVKVGNYPHSRIDCFLRTMVHNPELRSYVRMATVEWDGYRDYELYLEDLTREGGDEDMKLSQREIEVRSLCAKQATELGCGPKLQEALLQGSESAQVMVLLMLLVNLEDLRIISPTSATQLQHEMTDLLKSGKYLPKLKNYYHEECTDAGTDDAIDKYLNCDGTSVRDSRIGLSGDDSPRCHDNLHLDFSKPTTGRSLMLESFQLNVRIFDAGWIKNLFTLSAGLQYLEFTYQGESECDCLLILRLCKIYSTTLRRISILMPHRKQRYDESLAKELRSVSWEDFPRLEHLEGPIDILLGPYIHSASAASWPTASNSPQFRYPKSLETITFHSQVFEGENRACIWGKDYILKLLYAVFSDYHTRFPKIKTVTFTRATHVPVDKFKEFLEQQDAGLGITRKWALE